MTLAERIESNPLIEPEGQLQSVLASENSIKRELFIGGSPLGGFTKPLFDEDGIKNELRDRGVGPEQGLMYLTAISRRKLELQRQQELALNPQRSDSTIIVSDSVIMLERDGGYIAVDRDHIDPDRDQQIIQEINDRRELVFVGAASFGRRDGQSIFTVLSYLKIPLGTNLTQRPIDLLREIPLLVDPNKEFTAGYVKYLADEETGSFRPMLTDPRVATRNFSEVLGYIPGLTPEFIALAETHGRLDANTAPILETFVEGYPFNSLTHYLLYERTRGNFSNLEDFYRILLEDRDFFERNGGNCYLQAWHLANVFWDHGMSQNFAVYPSVSVHGYYENGHSALIGGAGRFLVDMGLSIPFGIPVTELPLAPFAVGNKQILVQKNLISGLPDIVLLGPRGIVRLPVQAELSPDEYRMRVPGFMANVHPIQYHDQKIDFVSRDGKLKLRIARRQPEERPNELTIVTQRGTTTCNLGELNEVTESAALVRAEFAECGANFDAVRDNLSSLV